MGLEQPIEGIHASAKVLQKLLANGQSSCPFEKLQGLFKGSVCN